MVYFCWHCNGIYENFFCFLFCFFQFIYTVYIYWYWYIYWYIVFGSYFLLPSLLTFLTLFYLLTLSLMNLLVPSVVIGLQKQSFLYYEALLSISKFGNLGIKDMLWLQIHISLHCTIFYFKVKHSFHFLSYKSTICREQTFP